jgi:hypothetical protein
MTVFLRLLDPLRSAAVAFFKHDVSVRRGESGVRLVLEERGGRSGNGRPPSRQELATRKEREEVALMLAQLRGLLGELPETRQTMRHLVFLEQALARKGLRALHKLPLDVLQRALEQFEGLVTNWSPVGLASLRSKMAVAIIDREHTGPQAEADAYRTAAVLDGGLDSGLEVLLPPAEAEADAGRMVVRDEDDALAAAYAALGDLAPARVEMQGELGSPSARALAQPQAPRNERTGELKLRELQL